MKKLLTILFLLASLIGSSQTLQWFNSYPQGVLCVVPTVTTTTITAITSSGANSGGNVTADGGCSVTGRGIEWSYYSDFSSILGSTSNGTGTGLFTSSMSGLSDNTTFYVRAYATNSAGTGYGSTLSFTTLPSCTLPTVTTASITAILATSATGGGNVTATGGCAVTARGVCWSTSTNPTISNSHTTDGSGTGSFTSSITWLTCGLTYYARAYATNFAGTSYGSEVSFTTSSLNYAYYNFIDEVHDACNSQTITSYATAVAAASIIYNHTSGCGTLTAGGNQYRANSFSVGGQLYSFSTGCFLVTISGYRLVQSGATIYIINLSSGVISSIETYTP